MKKITPVWVAIIGLPLLIAVAPVFPLIYQHMMEVVIGVAALFVVLAWWNRARFDVLLAGFIGLDFLASFFLFPSVDERLLALRTAAITSFVFLNLVLLIGPWSRFSKYVLPWYRHRRHFGVVTFFLGLLHFSLVFTPYFENSFANAFMAFFGFFGFTGLFIMFWLALTSFDWQQKNIGNTRWKKIHFVIMVLYALTVAYAIWVNVSNNLPIPASTWIVFVIFFIFWVIVAPWGLAPKFIKYLNGWKQLHVLVHLAFLSLVLHAWFIVSLQAWWMQILFFCLITLTWGSHLVGWLIKWREDQQLKKQAAQSQKIEIEGKPYWSLLSPDQFVDGRGRKFLVNGLPVAVFRYQEKFFGLFAICAHQKGPMEKGKIVNGYVECPWHGWQYSCDGGLAPPGHKDRLAFYPCVVREGMVYVSQFPKRAE